MLRRIDSPLEKLVTAATAENLTQENWSINLQVCDKINEEPTRALHALNTLVKRLKYKNANVQLYSLTLLEAIEKNCSIEVRREIGSKVVCQTLIKLINDGTVHKNVKRKISKLLIQWASDFEVDDNLDLMRETIRSLRYIDSDLRDEAKNEEGNEKWTKRNELEDLELALALSFSETTKSVDAIKMSSVDRGTENLKEINPGNEEKITKVRALYDFNATEDGELAFRKGDIIIVVETLYKDWWRGCLRGKEGIFPVNYVEISRDLSGEELQKEAEEEKNTFSQLKTVDQLLEKLTLEESDAVNDPQTERLYSTVLQIRPKIIRLIEKYAAQKDTLMTLNEKYLRARKNYDHLLDLAMTYTQRRRPLDS